MLWPAGGGDSSERTVAIIGFKQSLWSWHAHAGCDLKVQKKRVKNFGTKQKD